MAQQTLVLKRRPRLARQREGRGAEQDEVATAAPLPAAHGAHQDEQKVQQRRQRALARDEGGVGAIRVDREQAGVRDTGSPFDGRRPAQRARMNDARVLTAASGRKKSIP